MSIIVYVIVGLIILFIGYIIGDATSEAHQSWLENKQKQKQNRKELQNRLKIEFEKRNKIETLLQTYKNSVTDPDFLNVKISEIFKKRLRKKFDLRRFKKRESGRLDNISECVLCEYYQDTRKENECKGCPFYKFQYKDKPGCRIWANLVYPPMENIPLGNLSVSKDQKEDIQEFKRRADKYIDWFENNIQPLRINPDIFMQSILNAGLNTRIRYPERKTEEDSDE